MLVITEQGFYFTAVEDLQDPGMLYVRSQDRASIEDLAETLKDAEWELGPEIVDEPTWDYQFRVRVTRADWAFYLERASSRIRAHKLKPAVAKARGKDHPVSRLVEAAFYFMSENRPDGSKPAWLSGAWKK